MTMPNLTSDMSPEQVLEEAAQAFERIAMGPEYGERERARILGCATWLRDFAQEVEHVYPDPER